MSDDKLKGEILKFALQNAVLHDGRANPKAVLGKILSSNKELRSKAKEVLSECSSVCNEVNSLSLDEQRKRLEDIAPELLNKKKRKKDLPELPNAEMGKVVTRIPPEPSKYAHIGHALSFLINYIYAKKYKGRCVFRFEDTNPEKSTQEFVDAMKEDVLEYLDIKPDEIKFVSDDMDKFYEYAEVLIRNGKAYVCSCSREKMHELRNKGVACDCRSKSVEENLKEWDDMLKGKFKEGERVLRLKGDMTSKNYVMRDPVLFRISYTPHYRHGSKYCVYPLYDFENSVEEELCGVTHILRSAEFGRMRVELQDYIKELLGFKKQTVIQYGRFNIVGATTQGREIREMIEKGEVIGWDDPKLVTLRALRRRGIQKEAYYELARIVGLSPTPTNIDWNILASINRKIVDKTAKRLFFIDDPVEIKIKDAPSRDLKLRFHPEQDYGFRVFNTNQNFLISRKDFEQLKEGELYRLMDCLNFTKKKGEFLFDSEEYEKFKGRGSKIIHWLPAEENLKAEVFMPDHKLIEGLIEKNVDKIKIDEVVQLERFGFVKLDHLDNDKRVFWFTHK